MLKPPHNHNNPAVSAYFSALGEFFHEFGLTENHLAHMLQRFAQTAINDAYRPHIAPEKGVVTPEPLADILRALLGSQRSKPLSEIIEALLRISGSDEATKAELKDALGQFGHIRFIRDKIAHQGAWPEENEGQYRWRSFPHQGREPKDIKTLYFKVDDLHAATWDLRAIRGRITAAVIPERMVREIVEKDGHFLPWQYKPVQPDHAQKRASQNPQ